jgi:hypothetical protein
MAAPQEKEFTAKNTKKRKGQKRNQDTDFTILHSFFFILPFASFVPWQ